MKPEIARQIVMSACFGHSLGGRYINEGEHQDGERFWENFQTKEEIVEDFIRWYNFQYPDPKVNPNVLFSHTPRIGTCHAIELNPDTTCNLTVNGEVVMSGQFNTVRDYYVHEFAPPEMREAVRHLQLKF